MKKKYGKLGIGLLTLASCLIYVQTNVKADITDEQQQLIQQQVQGNKGKSVPGELIVGMENGKSIDLSDKNQSNLFGINAAVVDDLTLKSSKDGKEDHQVLLIKFDEKSSLSETIKQLNALPEIEYAEPNYIVETDPTEKPSKEKTKNLDLSLKGLEIIPNDKYWDRQWGPLKINAPTAWDESEGSKDVKVAVIDTGIDYNHVDLAENVDASLGYDFVDNDNDPQDEKYHGTHVAGIIGASTNNNIGVAGLNWDVTMVPIRVLDGNGKGNDWTIIQGINWATENGYPIANYSIGSYTYSYAVENAIRYYPGLFVVAAGNDGEDYSTLPTYPAALDIPNMITVGNSDEEDQRSTSSSYSKTGVDLFAPGHKIFSTIISNGYSNLSGTSMAAPFVTGSAALALAKNNSLTTKELKSDILTSVDQISDLSEFCVTGGRLNVSSLMDTITDEKIPAPTVDQPVSEGDTTITG